MMVMMRDDCHRRRSGGCGRARLGSWCVCVCLCDVHPRLFARAFGFGSLSRLDRAERLLKRLQLRVDIRALRSCAVGISFGESDRLGAYGGRRFILECQSTLESIDLALPRRHLLLQRDRLESKLFERARLHRELRLEVGNRASRVGLQLLT